MHGSREPVPERRTPNRTVYVDRTVGDVRRKYGGKEGVAIRSEPIMRVYDRLARKLLLHISYAVW